ncbi:hypothetical protein [Mycobacterium sp. 141]|uniref:hypothetical protein n=1 Tax=Mycobacterium sp. 141 TaxID=1120797 RepID=UPI0012DC2DF7|nr:hypothetical protein [Mycobacterium sp. 141]
MFERERIVQLRNQGYCTAAITVRLDVPGDYVRQVVAKEAARQAVRNLRPEVARRIRREKAEDKRDKALQLLREADTVLRTY